jgi:hypothetical protein
VVRALNDVHASHALVGWDLLWPTGTTRRAENPLSPRHEGSGGGLLGNWWLLRVVAAGVPPAQVVLGQYE